MVVGTWEMVASAVISTLLPPSPPAHRRRTTGMSLCFSVSIFRISLGQRGKHWHGRGLFVRQNGVLSTVIELDLGEITVGYGFIR